MKLGKLRVSRVGATLARSVGQVGARQWTRAGLLLEVEDAEGRCGLGEASPLPGYSPDSLQECLEALECLDPAEVGARLGSQLGFTSDALAGLGRCSELLPEKLPAARFALETALLDLLCLSQARPPLELLGAAAPERLPVNALLDTAGAAGLEQARSFLAEGYRTLKLKLGPDVDASLVLLQRLSREAGVKLRADANRLLDQARASKLLPELARLGLEFLEEPCQPSDWSELPDRRPPLALDESLQSLRPDRLAELLAKTGATVLVLKPMALGGYAHCAELARAARHAGAEVVVTHLFDGPIAHRAASCLALALHGGGLAAGLAPHPALAAWPPADLALDAGCIVARKLSRLAPPQYAQLKLGGDG